MAADDEAATAATDDTGGPSSVKDAAWTGTYLYMSPEATGLNAETGYPKGHIALKMKKDNGQDDPLFGASDTFSFGVMLFIMMTREARWFETDGLELPSFINKQGKPEEDMKTVARWYFNGKRPQFEDSFPPLLRLLIEGCWADSQSNRLRFVDIEALLKNGEIDWLAVPPAVEAETYDGWLERVGVADKKDELYEYDVREGKGPLEKLVEQLTEEAEDFADMLEDLFEDEEEMQASFREAVEQLTEAHQLTAAAGGDGGAGDSGAALASVLPAAVISSRQFSDARTPKEKLLALLPKSEHELQLAAKDEQLAEAHEQLAQLQAQLDGLKK
jgi:hypothetical protein